MKVEPICGKCGRTDVSILWHGEGIYHKSRRGIDCGCAYEPAGTLPYDEHLHYRCRTCGFDWLGPLTPVLIGLTLEGDAPALLDTGTVASE